MTASPPRRLRRTLRLAAYRTFYALPNRWRRRLVRLGSPGFTVGSVVIVREVPSGRLLLLRQPPGPGWSLPGGLLARGEQPVAGAARELAEETGLLVAADRLQPGIPNAIVHSHGQWIDMVFETEVPAGAALAVDEAEVYEADWFALDSLPPLTQATERLLGHYGIGRLADDPVHD